MNVVTETVSLTGVVGGVAGFVSALAFLPYVLAIHRGETVPNRATWLIWTVIGWLTLVSYYEVGAESTIWLAVSYAFFHTVIFFMSITRGEGGWSAFDLSCTTIAIIGLALWGVMSSALAGLICFLFADFVAALPTIRKSRDRPFTEDRLAWSLSAVGAGISLFALDQLSIGIVIYPVYMFVVHFVISFFVWRPVLKQKFGSRS